MAGMQGAGLPLFLSGRGQGCAAVESLLVLHAYRDRCQRLEVPLRWQQDQEVFVSWKWSKINIDL